MKRITAILLLLSLLQGVKAAAAPGQYSRTLEPFTDIVVSGSFEVSVMRGADFRALMTVEEPFMDYVTCSVSRGVLTVSIDERKVPSEIRKMYRGKGTPDPVFYAIVYVPDSVRSVTLSDKGVLRDCDDIFDKSSVSFELGGGSRAKDVFVNSRSVRIKMQQKSSGDFRVKGGRTEMEATHSATLTLDDESEDSFYSMQGSSKVTAKVKAQHLSVTTKANCTLKLYGSADSAAYFLSGTSEVDALNLEVPDAKVTMSSVCKLTQAAYKTLTVNLNGGSTLVFANNPVLTVESIKSATVLRSNAGRTATEL